MMTNKEETLHSFVLKINQSTDENTAIIAVDDTGIIHFWNKQSESLLGYSSEDAHRKDINKLLLAENSAKPLFIIPEATKSTDERHDEIDLNSKQGNTIKMSFKLVFFYIHNTCIGIYYLKIANKEARRVNYDVGTRPAGPLTPEYSLLEGSSLSNSGSEWLISYLDIMTLILIFFILAFSMTGGSLSNHEIVQLTNKAIKETILTGDLRPLESLNLIEKNNRSLQYQKLLNSIEKTQFGDQLDVIDSEGDVSLRIKDNILFSPGQALISEQGELILDEITTLIQNESYKISIEGHTDSVPITSTIFPSNWELSSARATSVVRLLLANGIKPQRLKATGYADTQPLIISSKKSVPANRRVEIVLHIPE